MINNDQKLNDHWLSLGDQKPWNYRKLGISNEVSQMGKIQFETNSMKERIDQS